MWKLREPVAQADSLRLEFLHFVEHSEASEWSRGAAFQGCYAAFLRAFFVAEAFLPVYVGIHADVPAAFPVISPEFLGTRRSLGNDRAACGHAILELLEYRTAHEFSHHAFFHSRFTALRLLEEEPRGACA